MSVCAKCNTKLADGITRCPGCKASLAKPGAFMEVLGWVVMVISLIPIIIGEKTLEQHYYVPVIVGGVMLVAGLLVVLMAKSRSRIADEPIREDDATPESTTGRS